jgi:riboflavin kinase/FMN adenylyltransferase
MRRYGEEFGFTVSVTDKVEDGAGKISSSAVRDALRAGRPELAQAIMGRPFAIEGLVQKGRQLGRQLGFPTANVPLGDYVAPKLGVYATRTRLADGRIYGGVANIGVNPTTGIVDARLEVWLFDFDEDIYGEIIETDLIEFLRPEETFRRRPVRCPGHGRAGPSRRGAGKGYPGRDAGVAAHPPLCYITRMLGILTGTRIKRPA